MTTGKRSEIRPGVPAPGMAGRMGASIDARRGVEYRELRAASLVNRFNGRPMPFGWTVNPYRGCEMACRYCYARYTHEFLGQNDPEAFERCVWVKKTNRVALVAELRRARKSGRLVALGTATDPYQPAEARFEVTRRLLEAARDVPGVRLSITTKGTLVARDAELLAEIARGSELSVNFSITTADPALARRLEPRAPRPDLRFGAMAALVGAGIETRLFVMPVLPLITDGEDNLRALLGAARAAGASTAESNVLFLRAGTRETFFAFLAAEFPQLVPEYERLYAGSAYAARRCVAEIEARVSRLSNEAGFPARRLCDRPDDGRRGRQLSLVW
ncbi:MAG: radical SAM protein [Candidatus Rokubacteria bacterium]|nr:radical SAM protein [Candidatus Rokubacteria bacterium]